MLIQDESFSFFPPYLIKPSVFFFFFYKKLYRWTDLAGFNFLEQRDSTEISRILRTLVFFIYLFIFITNIGFLIKSGGI